MMDVLMEPAPAPPEDLPLLLLPARHPWSHHGVPFWLSASRAQDPRAQSALGVS